MLIAVMTMVGGCLSFDEPTPTPAPPSATPAPSPAATMPPRDDDTLVIAAPSDPLRLLPPADDLATALLVDLLYDPLYRLDESLVPQPELAVGQPVVSGGGTTWTVTLAGEDLRFQDGTPLRAADVVFSLELARSSACSLGRDLCDTVSQRMLSVVESSPTRVSLTLDQPYQPFLAEVLARLPIVSEVAVRAGTASIVAATAGMDAGVPDEQVARIADATDADACLSDAPPFGCRLADHISELEGTLARAELTPPSRIIFTDITGNFDGEAYAGVLLDRVAALGQVLTGVDTDQLAAALPLLDPTRRPLGSGPYRLIGSYPGSGLELAANPYHVGGEAAIGRISVRVAGDPATATTLLLTGSVDWLLEVEPDQVPLLEGAAEVRVGLRPLQVQRTIVFNVRSGRVYDDVRTRQAFALCLDRSAIAADVTDGGVVVATTPTAAGSWAMAPAAQVGPDVAAATALLEAAGWRAGDDGIRAQGGQRLASEVAVRPSRSDLLAFANAASESLRACGIELTVRELDLTGDLLLGQLQWPNDFDTVLVSRGLGPDPDADLRAYEGSHATSSENPADANPGGYASADADALIAEARQAPSLEGRAGLYAQLQGVLEQDVPAWPIWYDSARAAISARVIGPAGGIDPGRPRYDWDVASWSLRPLP